MKRMLLFTVLFSILSATELWADEEGQSLHEWKGAIVDSRLPLKKMKISDLPRGAYLLKMKRGDQTNLEYDIVLKKSNIGSIENIEVDRSLLPKDSDKRASLEEERDIKGVKNLGDEFILVEEEFEVKETKLKRWLSYSAGIVKNADDQEIGITYTSFGFANNQYRIDFHGFFYEWQDSWILKGKYLITEIDYIETPAAPSMMYRDTEPMIEVGHFVLVNKQQLPPFSDTFLSDGASSGKGIESQSPLECNKTGLTEKKWKAFFETRDRVGQLVETMEPIEVTVHLKEDGQTEIIDITKAVIPIQLVSVSEKMIIAKPIANNPSGFDPFQFQWYWRLERANE